MTTTCCRAGDSSTSVSLILHQLLRARLGHHLQQLQGSSQICGPQGLNRTQLLLGALNCCKNQKPMWADLLALLLIWADHVFGGVVGQSLLSSSSCMQRGSSRLKASILRRSSSRDCRYSSSLRMRCSRSPTKEDGLLFDSTVVVVVAAAVLVVALVLGAWDVPKVRSAGDPMASESSYTGFAKPSLQLGLKPKEISAFQKKKPANQGILLVTCRKTQDNLSTDFMFVLLCWARSVRDSRFSTSGYLHLGTIFTTPFLPLSLIV